MRFGLTFIPLREEVQGLPVISPPRTLRGCPNEVLSLEFLIGPRTPETSEQSMSASSVLDLVVDDTESHEDLFDDPRDRVESGDPESVSRRSGNESRRATCR